MRFIFTTLALAISVGSLQAATIKIAFHNGSGTVTGFNDRPDGVVFASSTETINNFQNTGGLGLTFSAAPLRLADGSTTSAALSVTAGFSTFNNNGWGGGTDDAVMMEGWYGFKETESITFSGLATAFGGSNYNITIYGDSDNNRTMDYTIGGLTKTINDVGDYPGGSSPALIEGTDFVTFTNLSGDGATQIFGNATGSRSAINGIVITSIPEPSALALTGLAGLAFLVRRRR